MVSGIPNKGKDFKTDRQGRISVSPALHAQKEKGKLKMILKRLIQLRKGH